MNTNAAATNEIRLFSHEWWEHKFAQLREGANVTAEEITELLGKLAHFCTKTFGKIGGKNFSKPLCENANLHAEYNKEPITMNQHQQYYNPSPAFAESTTSASLESQSL